MSVVRAIEVDVEYNSTENRKLVSAWQNLKNKLEKIYAEDSCVHIVFLAECYDQVHEYVSCVNKEQIALRSLGKQQFHPGRSHLVSKELYYCLIGYIGGKTDKLVKKFDEIPQNQIFESYCSYWNRFKLIHTKIQFVFKYLDRFFVPDERTKENGREIHEIYHCALLQWREKIFKKYEKLLIDEILRFLRVEREGRKIDQKMVACASKSFIELGKMKQNSPLKLYAPLEEAFIDNTRDFYHDKGQKFMRELNLTKTMSFDDYMNAVHSIFANETERVETYLDASSVSNVLKVCEESLIKNHFETFSRKFEEYLVRGDFEKIGQFYDLIKRFPEKLEPFRITFKLHVQKEGDAAIGKLDNVMNVDAQIYVETILDVCGKYEKMIKNEMDNNEIFMKALDESSKVFINENAVTLASGYGDRNAELLAKYCDVLLSKNSQVKYPEELVEKNMNFVWNQIFKVLNDKDGFQKFYENITARRLIFDLSVSDEIEKNMITQLRDYFGKQDSKALREIMLNKMLSEGINEEFMASVQREKDEKVLKNFKVTILSERSWPFTSASVFAISKQFIQTIPTCLEHSVHKFTKFYTTKFAGIKQPKERKLESCGRRIQWLHNLGKGELNAQFLGKTYVLQTGAFQMTVLMQFNEWHTYTYEELKKNTGIMTAPAEFLQQTLSKLFEAKILLCDGDYSELQPKTKIKLNEDFRDKRVRINLDQTLDAEVEINRKELLKHIDNDREILTQCAIVRVMKRCKRLHRTDLMQQVIVELTKRFKPEPQMITRSMQLSVGKDLIEVDKSEPDFYLYID